MTQDAENGDSLAIALEVGEGRRLNRAEFQALGGHGTNTPSEGGRALNCFWARKTALPSTGRPEHVRTPRVNPLEAYES